MRLRRYLAFIIDCCLVTGVASLLLLPLSDFFEQHGTIGRWSLFVLMALYFAIFDSSLTPKESFGKRWLGLHIQRSTPLQPWQALLRKLLVLFPFHNDLIGSLPIFRSPTWARYAEIPFFAAIGFCVVGVIGFAIFSNSRQGIHDHIFKTQVMKSDANPVPLNRLSRSALISLVLATFAGALVPSFTAKEVESMLGKGKLNRMQELQIELAAIGYEGVSVNENIFKSSYNSQTMNSLQLIVPMSYSRFDAAYKKAVTENILPLVRKKFEEESYDDIRLTFLLTRFVGLIQLNSQETENHPFLQGRPAIEPKPLPL